MDLYPNAGFSSISEFSRTFLSNISMFIYISLKFCCLQYIIKEMKLFNEFFPFFIMPCLCYQSSEARHKALVSSLNHKA